MHLTGGVTDFSVRMSGSIIEKVVDSVGDIFPVAGGDGGSDGADCRLHGIINGSGVIVENAGEFLAVLGLCWSELSGASGLGKLLFLAVDGGIVWVW